MSLKAEERCAVLLTAFSHPEFAEANGVASFPAQRANFYIKRIGQHLGPLGADSEVNGVFDEINIELKAGGRAALIRDFDEAVTCDRRAQ
jgi:hypothetical protein